MYRNPSSYQQSEQSSRARVARRRAQGYYPHARDGNVIYESPHEYFCSCTYEGRQKGTSRGAPPRVLLLSAGFAQGQFTSIYLWGTPPARRSHARPTLLTVDLLLKLAFCHVTMPNDGSRENTWRGVKEGEADIHPWDSHPRGRRTSTTTNTTCTSRSSSVALLQARC